MIGPFINEWEALSNFYPSRIKFEGKTYPTVEHAYQAAKTLDPKDRKMIRDLGTPGKAKRIGQRVSLRPGWEKMKLSVMKEIVMIKFTTNPELKQVLLSTGNEEIAEVNSWGDTFWGVCNGKGKNHLGRILMEVRDEIRSNG